jgi:D-alanyl-D-alanine-carboxypeptidase/D-alanyl-D-alanine-endopeptidase
MKTPSWSAWLALILVGAGCGSAGGAPTPVAPTAAARGAHAERVETYLRAYRDGEILFGAAVALIEHDKIETFTLAPPAGRPAVTADTWFELGSVTKVYTGLLLADAVERDEVALDTAAVSLLPPGSTMPMGARAITLGDLVAHRAGLPRLPPTLAARANPEDPFGGYDADALLTDLEQTGLVAEPGRRQLYSNFGSGLLGYALGVRGGGYEATLRQRVLGPLGLASTAVVAPAGVVATGHDREGQPVPLWTFDALAGAAGLRSTVRDQAEFVRANLAAARGGQGPLASAMRLSHTELEAPGPDAALRVAMGWFIDEDGRRWHSGETGGFHAFVAFDAARDQGVVVLAATGSSIVDKVGLDLMDVLAGKPVADLALPSADELAAYAGLYVGGADAGMRVVVEGKRLYSVDGSGQRRVRLIPLSARAFFVELLDAIVVMTEPGAAEPGLTIEGADGAMFLRRVPASAVAPAAPPVGAS